ncbi:hypothetical protein M0R04_11065 [Candidatus Dojkabacteria bacterium]|jgi:hypothetical protein|nr:hypothetical protein [Candidatus Dojkabacteria bacterium]
MGNKDGFGSALSAQGTNKVINFKGGYFSFAFGNEIAFVLDGKEHYWILNCSNLLFNEVKELVKSNATKQELIKFWKDKSKEYEISMWSSNFDSLKVD